MAKIESKPYQTRRYFAGAPTRDQAKRIYWDDLKALTSYWHAKPPSESNLVIYIKGARGISPAEVYVVGMDKPQRIEGQPWDGGILDEYGNMKPEAWAANVRPALSDRNAWCWLIGVPEGRNHYYDIALEATGGAIPETIPGQGVAYHVPGSEYAFYSWHSADILSPAEITSAKRMLDEKTFNQEYQGSFESYEGLAYYSFGQHNLQLVRRNPTQRVSIGMDFNVNPMTAAIGHISGISFRQFDEAYLRNSNTYEMVEHLKSKGYKPENTDIYPDATGKRTTSNATESDLAILRKAGYRVIARSSNPAEKNRVNAVNTLIKQDDKEIRYIVDPSCRYTINDFNKLERLPDGRLNKAQEAQGLKHITDALGYLVAYNWSIKSYYTGAIKRT